MNKFVPCSASVLMGAMQLETPLDDFTVFGTMYLGIVVINDPFTSFDGVHEVIPSIYGFEQIGGTWVWISHDSKVGAWASIKDGLVHMIVMERDTPDCEFRPVSEYTMERGTFNFKRVT